MNGIKWSIGFALVLPVAESIAGELWVGGWSSDNVARFDAETGEYLGDFITPGSGGLDAAHHFGFGPDGHFYVASYSTSSVLRYDGRTGEPLPGPLGAPGTAEFVPDGSGMLLNAHTTVWGIDGNLLVASEGTNRVNRYDAATGAFIDAFIEPNAGGLVRPEFMAFGPLDGDIYLSNGGGSVLRYNELNGDFIEAFVTPGSGGLSWAHQLAFGPDGHLYVPSSNNNAVMRYHGGTGEPLPGPLGPAGTAQFVPAGSAALNFPLGMAFGPDGNLFVTSFVNNRILEFDGQSGEFIDLFANVSAVGVIGPTAIAFFEDNRTPGDGDGDGDVDRFDFERYLDCRTGPEAGRVPDDCSAFDIDADADVDFADLAGFQIMHTGVCGIIINEHPANVSSCEGDAAEFHVEVIGENLSYQWRRDGKELPGENQPTLTIDPVTHDNAGTYACAMSGNCDALELSNPASLNISPPVMITAQPIGDDLCIGDTLFIFVVAQGAETFQWFKDDVAIPGATSSFFSRPDVTKSDAGEYHVVATGSCDAQQSEFAQITITDCGTP